MAKRCLVLDVREGKDQKTNEELVFITCSRLPSKMKNGGLWHSTSKDLIINICINKNKDVEGYQRFSKVLPGTLVDVTFGVNEFTNKHFVATVTIVPNCAINNPNMLFV